MRISHADLAHFRRVVRQFGNSTQLAKYGRWRRMRNEDIWKAMVYQIVAVGNSSPTSMIQKSSSAKHALSFRRLLSVPGSHRVRHINRVFREFGVRYAARDPDKCSKSKAVVRNLLLLKSKGGPRRFLVQFRKRKTDHDKVLALMSSLSFIKSKGARDLLIELGMVKDAIAFDSRLQTVLKAMGIKTPRGFTSNEKVYRAVEKTLLEEVCKPLDITGSYLDRMLFQHAGQIVDMFR